MVYYITNVINEYQDRLREMPYVPKTSYRRHSLGYSGDANKNFRMFLFSDKAAGIQFLKSVELYVSVPEIIQFTQLLANAASTDWSSCTNLASSG
jgi:hypothetical protein